MLKTLKKHRLIKLKNKKPVSKTGIAVMFLLVVIGVEIINLIPTNAVSPLGQPGLSLETYAKNVVNICKNAPYRPSCYDNEIPKLMDPPISLSMENAFNVTIIVQNLDKSYVYCHVLGHELSAKEVDKDPSKWEDVITRCPVNVCSNGCLHGGFQERFRAVSMTKAQVKQIIPQLENICEKRKDWSPTGMEQASCYHAIGHLVMYITNADIKQAINLCKIIAVKPDGRNYLQLCYDGVFMQIFQPLEPEDFALVKGKQPTKQTLLSFCNNYTGESRGSCISESWPLFNDQLASSDGILKFCSMETPDQTERCYHAMFYVMAPRLNFDIPSMESICKGLPSNISPICFSDIASRMIETDYRNIDKSVEVCVQAQPYDPNNRCFNDLLLYSKYDFIPGSAEFYKMCDAMPEPWKSRCLE